jgi:YD repeat-containing protein
VLPKFFYQQNGSNQEECRTIVNKYNKDCQIVEFVDNSINKCFIYSYISTYLITESHNATSAEVGHTSFENNETNEWVGCQAIKKNNDSDTKTGEYYGKIFPSTAADGISKVFEVGVEAEKHPGYTASVWVKGGSDAFIHIEVNNNWDTKIRKFNSENTGGWNLLVVDMPKSKYESYMGANLKLKVYVGGDSNALWDDIRFYPSDAAMTTYTYAPLIGMTSQSDANNMPTYYEYDEFGRLKYIRDHERNILKSFDYNYAH